VLDLNHILLFLAVVSPAILLVQAWRGAANPAWRNPALAVLVVSCVAWLLARQQAGFIGGGAWLLLLFLPVTGMRKSLELAQRGRFKSAHRIVRALRLMHPGRVTREHAHLIRAIETAHEQGRCFPLPPLQSSMFGRMHARLTPAVAILIGLNAGMFALQTWLGGSTNPMTLHRLGALEPYAVLSNGEYWRLVAPLFLHYGAAHLLVNLFALQFFGPTLEAAVGSLRFTACYLISGVASCIGITLMSHVGWQETYQLVGASACVMGIVGAWGGFLVRDRHLAENRRTLGNILIIVVVQSIFDILTPRVSMAAHLSGLTTGFLLGLLITPSRTSPPASTQLT
jgi:membrane associated rhomboid family serine protease